MINRILLLLPALVLSSQAFAQPSEDAVRRTLQLTKAESMIDTVFTAVEANMRQSLNAMFEGRSLSLAEQRALEQMPAKLMVVFRSEFNWARMEPEYIKIYQETFTAEEVEGLNAFYATPLGQAVIVKMPLVLQRSMALGQSRAMEAMPKVRAAVNEAIREAGLAQ